MRRVFGGPGRLLRALFRPRALCAAIAVVGLAGAVVFLVVPVDAALGRDPLLRLGSLGVSGQAYPRRVDCGSPVSGLRGSSGDTFYDIVRDDACHHAARRRAVSAIAAGAVTVVTGLLGMTVISRRRSDASAPGFPGPRAVAVS